MAPASTVRGVDGRHPAGPARWVAGAVSGPLWESASDARMSTVPMPAAAQRRHLEGRPTDRSMIRIIVAIERSRGLADDRGIPWQGRIPTDARHFRDETSSGTVLMGFRTYAEFERPLHDRPNFVLARAGSSLRPGFVAVPDLAGFFEERSGESIWVIGGAALFEQSLPFVDDLFLTRLDADFDCTKFFPPFEDRFRLESGTGEQVEGGIPFHFEVWGRRAPEDRAADPA